MLCSLSPVLPVMHRLLHLRVLLRQPKAFCLQCQAWLRKFTVAIAVSGSVRQLVFAIATLAIIACGCGRQRAMHAHAGSISAVTGALTLVLQTCAIA